MHACICVCIHLSTHLEARGQPAALLLKYCHPYFETGVLWLVAHLLGWVSRSACLIPRHYGYMYTPLCLAFHVASKDQTRKIKLVRPALHTHTHTHTPEPSAQLPMPTAMFHFLVWFLPCFPHLRRQSWRKCSDQASISRLPGRKQGRRGQLFWPRIFADVGISQPLIRT